ncbi:MAG: AAA family ATPase [Aureispira sp.]
MIKRISFQNYKLFKEEQELELCPITLIIGKNNSGKSAVLKLPVILEGSLKEGGTNPLKLNYKGARAGQGYADLFYNREPFELKLGMASSEESVSVLMGLQSRSYNLYIRSYQENGVDLALADLELNGLRNNTNPLETITLTTDYIGAFREFPTFPLRDISEEYDRVGLKGKAAFSLLVQYHRDQNNVLSSINAWFKENFEGWYIQVREISGTTPSYEITLSTDTIAAIDITDTGSGIRQVLPLIVRSFMPASEETLIVIEEPETHLHPAAHGNLAERFVDSYIEDNNRHYLVETHSENFLLRMRALVAQRKLRPEDLAIYYVDYQEESNQSILRRIEVDCYGNLPNRDWPKGIFTETSSEVRRIIRAQQEQGIR